MAKAKIEAGNCGFITYVTANAKGAFIIKLTVKSDCVHIQELADNLDEVDAINEISFHKGMPEIFEKGIEYCSHPACPVPIGIIKTVEVAAGFALPQEIKIIVEK